MLIEFYLDDCRLGEEGIKYFMKGNYPKLRSL